jgi:hypothetical protein
MEPRHTILVIDDDRDMRSEASELGRDSSQLERDLKAQFSKLGEDLKLSIEGLKAIQIHMEGNLHQLGMQLSVNKGMDLPDL